MKNISQAKLVRVPIPLPPLPLQTAFAEQAQRLEATARALDSAAAKAEATAAALSAQVFGSTPTKGNGHATSPVRPEEEHFDADASVLQESQR
jgi:hypothetical protein